MLVNCAICSDNFLPSSSLAGCPCGHVFHVECLLQWFERSKSCPQCRKFANERNMVRIYLNILENSVRDDPVALIQTIDSLNFELRTTKNDLNCATSKTQKMSEQLEESEKEITQLKDKSKSLKSQVSALRKYVTQCTEMEAEITFLRQENCRAEEKLQQVKSIHTILNGSEAEADNTLLKFCDGSSASKSMVTFCSALKKQLVSMERKSKENMKVLECTKNDHERREQLLKVAHKSELDLCHMDIKRLTAKVEKLNKENQKMKESSAEVRAAARELPKQKHEENTQDSDSKKIKCDKTSQESVDSRKPLGSKQNRNALTSNNLKVAPLNRNNSNGKGALVRKPTSQPSSLLFGHTRTSRLASSSQFLQKNLAETSKALPDGMVYDGLGGTVKGDHPLPVKRRYVSK